MKIVGVVAGALLLSGCATDGYGGGWLTFGAGANPVWYDGYYGPYTGGYWGVDGVFVFSDHGHDRRDGEGHFRRDQFGAAHRYRSHTPPRPRPETFHRK